MKFCVTFEVAAPCRWFKYEHPGSVKRFMFLWFSIVVFPYSWTEFLRLYRLALEDMKKDVLAHNFKGEEE